MPMSVDVIAIDVKFSVFCRGGGMNVFFSVTDDKETLRRHLFLVLPFGEAHLLLLFSHVLLIVSLSFFPWRRNVFDGKANRRST